MKHGTPLRYEIPSDGDINAAIAHAHRMRAEFLQGGLSRIWHYVRTGAATAPNERR